MKVFVTDFGMTLDVPMLNMSVKNSMRIWRKWLQIQQPKNGRRFANLARNHYRTGMKTNGGPTWKRYFIVIDYFSTASTPLSRNTYAY